MMLLNYSIVLKKVFSFDTLLTVDPAKVLTSKANINTKSPENSFTSKALKTDVKQLLNNLKPIEKQVIESRFGFNDSPPKNSC